MVEDLKKYQLNWKRLLNTAQGNSTKIVIVYRVLEKGLQALRGYSTCLNEKKSPSQHMSRNQCLLRYGRVFEKFAYEKSGKYPGTSVRRIAAAGGIGVRLAWRILHE
jgi:hypothetical protein